MKTSLSYLRFVAVAAALVFLVSSLGARAETESPAPDSIKVDVLQTDAAASKTPLVKKETAKTATHKAPASKDKAAKPTAKEEQPKELKKEDPKTKEKESTAKVEPVKEPETREAAPEPKAAEPEVAPAPAIVPMPSERAPMPSPIGKVRAPSSNTGLFGRVKNFFSEKFGKSPSESPKSRDEMRPRRQNLDEGRLRPRPDMPRSTRAQQEVRPMPTVNTEDLDAKAFDVAKKAAKHFDMKEKSQNAMRGTAMMTMMSLRHENQGQEEKIQKVVDEVIESVAEKSEELAQKNRAAFLARTFTVDELRDLESFWGSATGQKMIKAWDQMSRSDADFGRNLAMAQRQDVTKAIVAGLKKNGLTIPKAMEKAQ